MVDPHLQKLLETLEEAGFPRIGSVSAEVMRAVFKPLPVTTEVASVEDIEIPAAAHSIPARIYRNTEMSDGLIVYYHGGGWVFGSLDSVDATLRLLAVETGYSVLSIDYRLAPENPFPAGVEDSWDAYLWAADNRAALTGNADAALVVMGDSAGGNLAAVVALEARNAGDNRITQQVLIYPATEGDINALAAQDMEPPFLRLDEMIWLYDQYVPPEARNDPRVAPALTPSLSGLPPAVVLTAEYDLLTAEGKRYAARLAKDGVAVTELDCPGGIHGFFTMASMLPIGSKAISDVAQLIRESQRTTLPA